MKKYGTSRICGFTLIELLVVVAVIGILAAIALPNFLEAMVRSKVSRTKSDVRTIASAREVSNLDHNRYPTDKDSLVRTYLGRLKHLTTPMVQ